MEFNSLLYNLIVYSIRVVFILKGYFYKVLTRLITLRTRHGIIN